MIKMMTEGKYQHSEMAHARLSEGISVIFDQDTPSSSTSPPSPISRSSGTSRRPRARDAHRRTHRSSSSSSGSSNSRSRSRPRSRSHPRCHRPSSRCGCNSHRRHGHGQRRSPPRHFRAYSRSSSSSPSPDRSSRHKSHRSSSRSNSQRGSSRRFVGQYRRASPPPTSRTRSPSGSSGCSAVSLTLDEKRELLRMAKHNSTKILGVAHLELPESVKPILEERPMDSRSATPEPEEWVRPVPAPEKTRSQNSESESEEDAPSPKMSPKRKIISFSIHNSVAKPTVVAPSSAKVTSRVDSIGSRKPYGHWVPVRRTGHTSQSRKQRLTTSH